MYEAEDFHNIPTFEFSDIRCSSIYKHQLKNADDFFIVHVHSIILIYSALPPFWASVLVFIIHILLQYYIHSYLDVLHATSEEPVTVEESQEMDISFRMQETTSSSSLKDLSPVQRGCRFSDEPISTDLNVYSTTLCYMECRQKLAFQLCGCTPFFYVINRRKLKS